MEVVLKTKPDLILDFGSVRDTYVSLADNVQEQTKIPYILIDGHFEATPAALRGGRTSRTVRPLRRGNLRRIDAALAETPWINARVYPARGPDGLETGVVGSINTEIIEHAGGRNVADAPGVKGLVRASMEQVIVAPNRRSSRHRPIPEQHAHLAAMIRGHNTYYGITDNFRRLIWYAHQAVGVAGTGP